ncbi:DUF6298 domain-containing protein [Paenibacillus periandrae]|uniref:DUF6298 domain-containing protein n=1 Tax=Paenibacillus periandrae TaxID=1761741 RepID=UPI001F08A7CC|nr:DUF6298 domain-containing protein [Paenibacillus periandrae]
MKSVNWETEAGKSVHIALNATKDVTDAILENLDRSGTVSTVDLRYWSYVETGVLHAPPGGM